MSSPQKGVCKVCGLDTGDRRKAFCEEHQTVRRAHDRGAARSRRGGPRYRRNKLGTPNRHDDRQDGEATTRRLFALRQLADAGLPLFGSRERAKAD